MRWQVALTAIALVVAVSSATAVAGSSKDYSGSLVDISPGTVAFDVHARHGTPQRARFVAKDIEVACDGHPGFLHMDFAPMNVRFVTGARFEGARYAVSPAGVETYYRVQGRLRGNRARGTMVFFKNAPGPEEPDCSFNFGKIHWKAHRAG